MPVNRCTNLTITEAWATYVEQHMDIRDELHYRAMMEGQLPPEDEALLRKLNLMLDEVMPLDPGLPAEHMDLVEEVLRSARLRDED